MKRYISLPALIVIACFLFSGCTYTHNRYHDFRDVFDMEMGVTFARPKNGGFYILPYFRGRNYWEYMGAEVAICEPFISHFGLNLRQGFDPCQVIDFCLGWFFLDMYGDDLAGTKIGE
jgi:hypothetical protein